MYYFGTFAAIGLRVGLSIQTNEFMKLNEYQRSRSLFDLGKRSFRFQNQNFTSKLLSHFEPNFI